jgi:large subunit ribosomal protein L19
MALKGQQLIAKTTQPSQLKNFSALEPGDTVTVSIKVKEGEKERIQNFKGIIIRLQGRGHTRSFTVRKIAAGGVGVERTFPFNSPGLDSVERISTGQVRRSKLYYLRQLAGKKARIQSDMIAPVSNKATVSSEAFPVPESLSSESASSSEPSSTSV